jgi:hypothetical protein
MHERVLRGGPADLSLRLPCITKPLLLRTVTHRPVGPIDLSIHRTPLLIGHSPTSSLDEIGSAKVFYFLSILYYYYYVYNLMSNLIERLGWT